MIVRMLCSLLCLLTLPLPAEAVLRALLVGVSEYPTLTKSYQLEGPRNDVARLRQILLQRGFVSEQIRVVADGIDNVPLPTRHNILAALDELALVSKRGDQVLVFFAGHGSQQPADRTTPAGREENDGLHEIFLPRDIGTWNEADTPHTVENAIIDFELLTKVDAIRRQGAFVWGVFDTCHSATLVRSADEKSDVRWRHVLPQELGIAPALLSTVKGQKNFSKQLEEPLSRTAATTPLGGSVFFYATQTTEMTPELRLPLGAVARRPHGLFAYTVMQALENGTAMTYRQMAQFILNKYGAINEARATPLFTGTDLDAAVLGQAENQARVLPESVSYRLRVGVDASGCRIPCPLQAVVAVLKKEGIAGAQIDWMEAGADIVLKLLPDRLLFLPPSAQGQMACAPGIEPAACAMAVNRQAPGLILSPTSRSTTDLNVGDQIAQRLHAIARVTNLMRMAVQLSSRGQSSELAISVVLKRRGRPPLPITPESVPLLHPQDQLAITLHNSGSTPLDVTLLYADGYYGVEALFPNSSGGSNRLPAAATTAPLEIEITAQTQGIERLIAIAVAARKHAERADFSFLAQQPLEVLSSRGGGQPEEAVAFRDAAFADFTRRSGTPHMPSNRTTMQIFTLEVRP